MTAQIANGGYKIEPRIILDSNEKEKFSDLDQFIADKKLFSDDVVSLYEFIAKFKYKSLFRNPENNVFGCHMHGNVPLSAWSYFYTNIL